MSVDVGAIAAGAVMGAVASEVVENVKDKGSDAIFGATPDHGPVEMSMLVDILSRLERSWEQVKMLNCEPMFRKVVLNTNSQQGFQVKRGNWKHVSLLLAAALTIGVQTEIGEIDFALNKGWNAFDMPNDAVIWIVSGAAVPTTVIMYFGDDPLDITGV